MNQSQREWAKHLKRPVPQLPVGYTQLELFTETQMQPDMNENPDIHDYAQRLIDGVSAQDRFPPDFRLAFMVLDALDAFLLMRQSLASLDSRGAGYLRSLLGGNFMAFVADCRRYLGEDAFNRFVSEVENDAA